MAKALRDIEGFLLPTAQLVSIKGQVELNASRLSRLEELAEQIAASQQRMEEHVEEGVTRSTSMLSALTRHVTSLASQIMLAMQTQALEDLKTLPPAPSELAAPVAAAPAPPPVAVAPELPALPAPPPLSLCVTPAHFEPARWPGGWRPTDTGAHLVLEKHWLDEVR